MDEKDLSGDNGLDELKSTEYIPNRQDDAPLDMRKKSDVVIALECVQSVCFVMQQNGAPFVRSFSVYNHGQSDISDLRIKLSSSPEFFKPLYFALDTLPVDATYEFNNCVPVLDFDFLSTLSERVRTELVIEVETEGRPLKTETKTVNVLAYDEWPGYGMYPELLASFSTPQDPAVGAIVAQAAQLLKDEGLSFDGYQSNDPNVVNRQMAALYAVVKAKNIVYCMPPASFEQSGQKIRLPLSIDTLGIGTCLDTTMLFCACAEAVGINPVVFLYSGHAFPGFWLSEATFSECVNDDLSEVNKRMAGGMSQLTALESTQVTDKKSTYTQAVTLAKGRLEDGKGFICYIDIARARKAGVLPLPVRYEENGRYRVDREMYEANRQTVTALRVIDVDIATRALGDRMEKWKRDLLDITLKNPLINYKINKAGAPLLNFDIEAVEDALSEGKPVQIMPHPKELGAQISDITKLRAQNDSQLYEVLKNELSAGRLRSALAETELQNRLTTMYRADRLSVEENGASTLYLALGFLKWQEADKPNVDRYAPILLLPMQLSRRSARAGFTITMTGDEHQVNLSLIEMLRVNFKIDASGLKDVTEGEKGIDVGRLLTYLRKLIIDQKGWDVIEAASLGLFHFSKFVLWNDLYVRERALRTHPLTAALINGKTDSRLFDKTNEETNQRLYLPLQSDSSQTAAAVAAAEGRTFVLHGPPGTGKSQTITNIIANALAHNKRVLFVAEKQAALNVVKRRLEKLGLFDFCLELHSSKSQKRNFYEQFDKLLELAASAIDVQYDDNAAKLAESAAQLEAFNTSMHKVRPVGCSVYGGINRVLGYKSEAETLLPIAVTDITKAQYDDGFAALKNLTEIGAVLGEPVNSPFYGCEVKTYGFDLKEKIEGLLRTISENYAAFSAAVSGLSTALYVAKKPETFTNFASVAEMFFCLGEILHYTKKSGFVRFMSAVFSKRHRKMAKSPYYARLKRFVKGNAAEAGLIYDSLSAFLLPEYELNTALEYGALYEDAEDWGGAIYTAAQQFLFSLSTLRDHCSYNGFRSACAAFPQLKEVVDGVHTGEILCRDACLLFEESFWHCWVRVNVSLDPLLCSFSPSEYALKREYYKVLTEFIAALTQKEVYLKLAENLPNFKYASMSSAEPGILLKAVGNRGRGITIRQLFRRIPDLMSKVKPCMLMSPLSAAQYLPENFPEFDLVVFDEASQLLTSEAVGAASRGRAVVMVGDPNQLPPTTFFKSRADEAETDFELQDLESILDDMLTLNLPEKRLLWHYRSEHESLISFSNVNYYDNKLITFPSPDDIKSRVVFNKVEGVYERGSTRTNPKEAVAVVDALFNCLSDPEQNKLSYGIVTFNIMQQSLIEDLIDKRLKKEPSFEKFFSGCDEPVFVKNIESVQGDERDVIIFSITYGCDKDGKMTVNFGPVNRDGGWRRLNVAITRACKKILIFSTITPDMIDLSRTSSKGVKGLKDFMNYAINSRLYFKENVHGTINAALAADIVSALRARGYNAVEGAGRSANKIDVAVRRDDGQYVLGILCDNETAALHAGVRDREYGREGVLTHMGWALTRVYALEWWQNRARETDRLCGILEGGCDSHAAPNGATAQIAERLEESVQEITFDPSIKIPSESYMTADLKQNVSDAFYQYNYANGIIQQIRTVVRVEGPISEGRLYKTIATAWGIARMTQKFNAYVEQLIKQAALFESRTQNTRFYWMDAKQTDMKIFRPESERKAEDICKEEYAVAAHYILQNALSIGQDDLIRETAKLFGFIKTPTASMRIVQALSMLTVQGRIRFDGEFYKLA